MSVNSPSTGPGHIVPYTIREHGIEPSSELKNPRRIIIISYWIVLLLAVPIWWSTTSIERLSLPGSRVRSQLTKQLRFPIDISLDIPPAYASVLGILENELKTRSLGSNGKKWESLDIRLSQNTETVADGSSSKYSVKLVPGSTTVFKTTISERTLTIEVPENPSHAATSIADALEALLVPFAPTAQAQYAPRYRLAFSLLNEDASLGGAATGWAVEDSIRAYLSQTLSELSVLHNFTIESQVQYHAPLAFIPSQTPNHPDEVKYNLDQDQLKTFVNSAEWTLASSVSNDLVLHFILFVPALDRRPVQILQNNGFPANSNAFTLPQWGGIIIHNPPHSQSNTNAFLSPSNLAFPFALFRSQLHSLLGVPPLPSNVIHQRNSFGSLSPWQLDALLRRRALENTKGSVEALDSIVKLVSRIETMPVRPDVLGDVIAALDALDDVYTASPPPSGQVALKHSSEALTRSSRAFFNPGMVAMLYFPDEHKYAVYTPLFAPVAVPLIVAALKELKAWKKERKEARDRKTKGKDKAE